MWVYNKDNKTWNKKEESLELDNFDYYRQELKDFRFYSKCLSGSSYVPLNDTTNIYDILTNYKPKNWYISKVGSKYSKTKVPPKNPSPINTETLDSYYNEYLSEYGLTLKNLFTPERVISDSMDNIEYVDLATDSEININDIEDNLKIDGVRIFENQRILVKNQTSYITLSNSVDPNDYIDGKFELIRVIGNNTRYKYLDNTNGIYRFDGDVLIKENHLDSYKKSKRLVVSVIDGNINKGKEFHLARSNNGYYPTGDSNSVVFEDKKNYIIKNKVEYNNLFGINHNDIIKHGEQEYNYEGIKYIIPERIITVSEYGIILNHQSEISNIIRNKYKFNLRSITQTKIYYWVVGDNGVILRVRKHDFEITRIKTKIKTTNILNSISFYNDLNGVIVGDNNTILITKDGGITWDSENIKAFYGYSYNKVLFKDINNFYIGGNNGVFINFKQDLKGWVAYKRRISKFIDEEDEFLLVDNILDIIEVNIGDWNPSFRFKYEETKEQKELLFIVTSDDIIIHDTNNSIPFHTKFFYVEFSKKKFSDINLINRRYDTKDFYFSGYSESDGELGLFEFSLDNLPTIGLFSQYSNRLLSEVEPSFKVDIRPNSMYGYEDSLLYCGNESLYKISKYSDFELRDVDSGFESRLKSKLLFLDYDIASKLNFFDKKGNYILPSTKNLKFNPINSSLPSDFIKFEKLENELNWWEYYKDSISTFEYYGSDDPMSDSSKVVPSSTFYNKPLSESKDSVIINTKTNKLSDIKNLAPNINDKESSRYIGDGSISIPGSGSSYDIYFRDYLMIIKFDKRDFNINVGHVINFESDVINNNFLVNKIYDFSEYRYAYFYTNFNDSIINSLMDSGDIYIRNLNVFSDIDNFIDKFGKHYLSNGYSVNKTDTGVEFVPKFTNETSYYNLSCKIRTRRDNVMLAYDSNFLKFGYKPNYNILDYLTYLSEGTGIEFNEDKELLSLPIYENIPITDGFSDLTDSCYIDYNKGNSDIGGPNKIAFGSELYLEWKSIQINTFVDVELLGEDNNINKSNKLIVLDKYEKYVNDKPVYIIEFHKEMEFSETVKLKEVSISTRRKLSQISEDLQVLNNIQNGVSVKKYNNSLSNINVVEYKTLSKDLNFKLNTDSYAKAFLSDPDIIESVSGVIYNDSNNNLSMNITRLESKESVEISNTSNYNGFLNILCKEKHNLTNGEGVTLTFDGGENSSEYLNQQYFGYKIVTILDDYSFYVDVDYGEGVYVGNDSGEVKYIKRDPFLNYQPVDILDIGVDKKGDKSVALLEDNNKLTDDMYSLVDVDYSKFRFRLVDGLNMDILTSEYKWILEAEITDAIIGEDENGLVWYSGIWECGRWFGGTWISGEWKSGDWYGGIWKSKSITDNLLSVDIDDKQSKPDKSIWYKGRWFDGTWENGTWLSGRWYDGTWNDGIWNDGIWNDGIWETGEFNGGIWVLGRWESGYFGAVNAPAYWVDGTWLSGDFYNGMWLSGDFGSSDKESRFGIGAYNSRAATWKSGNWINGSFHSNLNESNEGIYEVSDIHKYAIWETGNWYSGDFYGGVVYNIDFKSGKWHGGILEDIQIIEVKETNEYEDGYIKIDGLYDFLIGYEISIIDNNENYEKSDIGSNDNPGLYRVIYSEKDTVELSTKIYIDNDIKHDKSGTKDPNNEYKLRLVSNFRSCNWKSGIWTNGIYSKGLWEGGIWYNGVFLATWT